MCSTTILEFTSTFIAADIFKNYFFMVKSICVQPPLLARLATVSVLLFSCRRITCPSSYYSSLGEEFPALRVTQISHIQKLLFHGQEYLRAAAPAGPLCYCFGMATRGEPSTWFPRENL
jgi:hypothetical protein